jgi:general transcription factor 3C polypeptide 3 (transcription factor C subunit 4)
LLLIATLREEQEATYNTGRAYHHLGLGHLAVSAYERVIEITAHRAATGADSAASDLGREAVHNLARICSASGSRDLARQIVRSLPV